MKLGSLLDLTPADIHLMKQLYVDGQPVLSIAEKFDTTEAVVLQAALDGLPAQLTRSEKRVCLSAGKHLVDMGLRRA